MKAEQVQKGHVLKFVQNGRTFNPNVGIKTYPQQTFGVSQQSPEQFKQKHTLIADNGYIYNYESMKQFEYPSQSSCFSINNSDERNKTTNINQKLSHNSLAFHRKKGRLSQFMDKNGWMSSVVPVMGFERSPDARTLSNRDRKVKISNYKPKAKYQSTAAISPIVDQDYFNTISMLMSEKLKIRQKRQDFIKNTAQKTSQKNFNSDFNLFHEQLIEQSLVKTSKDLYSTSSTFYNSKVNSPPKQRGLQVRSSKSTRTVSKGVTRLNSAIVKRSNFKSSLSKNIKDSFMTRLKESELTSPEDLNFEEWERKNCHSKRNLNQNTISSQDQMEQTNLVKKW